MDKIDLETVINNMTELQYQLHAASLDETRYKLSKEWFECAELVFRLRHLLMYINGHNN